LISYSWDHELHKGWVRALAERLRVNDGVDVTLDRWHLQPGDQLTQFMETAIRENDFVLIVCTPGYRVRSDERQGGVGYEGDIMTAEVYARANHRKFIPLHREGEWLDAAPSWLRGKFYLDFRGDPYPPDSYTRLLKTLHGAVEALPTVGPRPDFASTTASGAIPSAPDHAASVLGIPSTRVIGNIFYIETQGNKAKEKHFEIAIPDANKLDTNYQGVIAGIEFEETTHVGRAGVRNVALNGTTLFFDMFAEGAGIWGAGASYGFRVVAHYR
jgi:hypothetical protein